MAYSRHKTKIPGEISLEHGAKILITEYHAHENECIYVKMNNKNEGYVHMQCLQPIGRTPPIIDSSKVKESKRCIGSGTYGKVYFAIYDGKKYAVKRYRGSEERDMKEAKMEAECLNAVDHENIMKVFGICKAPVRILMEPCEGGSLNKLIKRDHFNYPLQILINWALQIAKALWYMHDRTIPIRHGDVKPLNSKSTSELLFILVYGSFAFNNYFQS